MKSTLNEYCPRGRGAEETDSVITQIVWEGLRVFAVESHQNSRFVSVEEEDSNLLFFFTIIWIRFS